MTESSLYAYAVDLAAFFNFVCESKGISIKEVSIKDFAAISEADIENYIESSRVYSFNGSIRQRSNYSLRRRFAILHSFYKYLYAEDMIDYAPTLKVTRPKYAAKHKVIPSDDDNERLIEYILNGELPSERASAFQEHFRERDAAIITLMVFMGLKASECVNLNICDLDLSRGTIYIVGREYPYLSISGLVLNRISSYLALRLDMIPEHGDAQALFLSLRGTRASLRSIQMMIKKYSSALFGDDKAVIGRNLSFSFINKVYSSSKSIAAASMLCGRSPETIATIYTADIRERLSKTTLL